MARHFLSVTPLFLVVMACAFLAWCSLIASASRTTHSILSSKAQHPTRSHSTKYLKVVEPLAAYHVTHGPDHTPLAGFHPDAPAVPHPSAVREAVPEDSRNEMESNDTKTDLLTALGDILKLDLPALDDETEVDDAPEWEENDLAHWSVGGAPHKYHKGQAQLFPDEIHLEFQFGDEEVAVDLHIIHELYNEHSSTELWDGDQLLSTHRHTLSSYWAKLADGSGWATATLYRDGRFQAIVHKDGDTIQVDPVEIHKQDMTDSEYRKLHQAAHRTIHPHLQKGLVVHRHSDFKDISSTHMCGSLKVNEERNIGRFNEEGEKTYTNASEIQLEPIQPYLGTSRRLLQSSTITNGYGAFPRNTVGIVAWTNCYFGDNAPQRVSVGFAVDTGMYQIWGSVSGVQQYISWQMSVINLVYLTQLNMFLTISDIVIASTISSTAPSWNDNPPSAGAHCPITITDKLNTLSSWRGSSKSTSNSIWNLQTNCYPPAGTVGLAWIGVLCNTYYGTSISTYSSNQWLTTAHEIGHNFGAGHTFELGQGQ